MTGRMWIATDPSTRMYLKVHQRVSFVFQETDEGLKCSHIHCSNPYQEMMEGEQFPEKIGRQSYEYVQERLNRLEEEMQKKNLQAEEDARRLREQTGLLSSIYDTVPCGIIRFSRSRDKGYRLISANRAALTLLGYDSVEAVSYTHLERFWSISLSLRDNCEGSSWTRIRRCSRPRPASII